MKWSCGKVFSVLSGAVMAGFGYGMAVSFPWWRVVGFTVGLMGFAWAADQEGYERAMKRYEQTRAYLLEKGYIND